MRTKPSKVRGPIDLRHNERVIAGYAATYRKVWESACKHDDIPPESKFVAFSDDNPFVKFFAPAMAAYHAAIAEAKAGGYIGLEISVG